MLAFIKIATRTYSDREKRKGKVFSVKATTRPRYSRHLSEREQELLGGKKVSFI